ncbi:hypothetical protein LJC59_01305 [Desulfovibrio sp. OttesenSCG-928-A18]|nr:hypothetical protein [Desulfovibrio sp. OttesenSCG-928-A18]
MRSTVHLFNIALARLGGEQLPLNISPQEDDATGTLCENLFPHVLDLALAAHEWGFAKRRVVLAQLPALEPASSEYRLRYALPKDCIKPVRIDGYGGINRSPVYIAEADGILTNEEQAVFVYVARITDPRKWPPPFVDALAWGLAGELASARLNDSAKQQWCYQNYRVAMADAIVSDLSDQNPHSVRSPWSEARGTGYWQFSDGRKL